MLKWLARWLRRIADYLDPGVHDTHIRLGVGEDVKPGENYSHFVVHRKGRPE